ncbi:hypothetical protein AB0392_34190 [Nonomuraea angiospora]|uniref:hypothetical protein n=1 Tax=Nonomuraea angiospora TaxID=46172 RepID=UPI00344FB7A9
MKHSSAKPPRARRPSTAELESPCGRCGCQNGGHTLGRRVTSWSQGEWAALFDEVFMTASGACATPDCDCPGRTVAA